jgi:mono/diheme cytochrome c family protein
MMKKRILFLLLPLLSLWIALNFIACKHEPEEIVNPDPEPEPCDTTDVTYNGTVYNIFQESCISCHSGAVPQGGIDLTDYSQVAFLAQNGALLGAIRHEQGYSPMPQGGNKLSDCKIRQVEIWIRDTTFVNPPDTTHPCDPDTIYFEMDVLPILLSSCGKTGCHDATAQGGVRLDSYAAVMASDVVTPFDPEESDMWEEINESDPDKIMPPPPNEPLNAIQKETIRKWIAQGALDLTCDADCDTSGVTFSGTIWPSIIQKHCLGCHSGATASGGIHLENYNDVKAAAMVPPGQYGSLLGVISHASGNSPMPKNQPKLDDCKIAQIQKWIEDGMPDN